MKLLVLSSNNGAGHNSPGRAILEAAHRRAVRNKAFWMMVYGGNGLSYQELREMDMADYREAVEARILYNTEWTKKRGGAS